MRIDKIMLVTACGCTRLIEGSSSEGLGDVINFPLDFPMYSMKAKYTEDDTKVFATRKFKYSGMIDNPFLPNVAVYRESL